MAAAADLVVLPVDLSMDEGIPKQRLAFALVRVGSDIELAEAVDYVREAGYFVLVGSIPERTAFRRASDAAVSRKRHSILLTNTPTSWRKQS